MAESVSLLPKGISQKVWDFIWEGGLFARVTFLWTIVSSINVTIYVALKEAVIGSNVAQNYLSADYLFYSLETTKFYLLLSVLIYVALILLRIFQNNISDHLLYFGIFIAIFNFIDLCHFLGGAFILVAPFFLIISVINISSFLSPKMGLFALFCSVILYIGSIILDQIGIILFLPIVLPTVTFNEIFSDPDLIFIFTISLTFALFIFGYFIVNVINQTYLKAEQTNRLNVELEATNRELQELDTMKDEFLAMISHDLRTPLTSIKGYTHLLRENIDAIEKDEQKAFLEIVESETDRLVKLFSDLLDLHRLEAGEMKFIFKDVDIIKLINKAIETFRNEADEKNLTIQKECSHETLLLKADRDRILQVLTNLLSNAIKFTQEGGLIKIITESVTENGNSAVKISFSDTGPGISKDKQSKLFDKFQRVYQAEMVKEQGIGLGLAIVKKIIEYHKGKVGLESEEGKGSTFYFILQ